MNIVNMCIDKNLSQIVNFPTHIRGNILDLVLTNIPYRVVNIENQGRLVGSDHMSLYVTISTAGGVEPSAEMVPDWRKADWAALRARLGRPGLLAELERRDAATVWEHLRDKINSAVSHSVPK